jgi:hypothetical protein
MKEIKQNSAHVWIQRNMLRIFSSTRYWSLVLLLNLSSPMDEKVYFLFQYPKTPQRNGDDLSLGNTWIYFMVMKLEFGQFEDAKETTKPEFVFVRFYCQLEKIKSHSFLHFLHQTA